MRLLVVILLLHKVYSDDEIPTGIHGDYGVRVRLNDGNKEDMISIESNRAERQIPYQAGFVEVVPAQAQYPVVAIAPTPVPVVEQHIHHHHIDHVVAHEEEVPEIDVWDIRDSVPGTPNEDYPVLRSIPRTKFSCDNRIPGYYADTDTKCQVFHRCSDTPESIRKKMDSFLCLNGTTFNQEILSCDWWENVRCESAHKFYGLNKELNMRGEDGKYIQLSAKRDSVAAEKPLAPRIIPKDERVPLPPQYRSPLNRIQATESPFEENSDDEVSEVELEDPPEISEVQFDPTTTPGPPENDDEDEEIAYFFTPKQIKDIRASKDFGDKLLKVNPTASVRSEPISTTVPSKLNSTEAPPNKTTSIEITTSIQRTPVYKSSHFTPKTKQIENELEKFEEKSRLSPNSLEKRKSSRKLRRVKKVRKQKEVAKNLITMRLGYPYPSQQVVVAPNGTAKLLKYKHLVHTDITESFPPYLSGVRPPLHPLYPGHPPHPYAPGQYPHQPVTLPGLPPPATNYLQHPVPNYAPNPIINPVPNYAPNPVVNPLPNYAPNPVVNPLPNYAPNPVLNPLPEPGVYPLAQPHGHPTVTYEHHHHHKEGTLHRALEPHHVFPPFQVPRSDSKLLAPHDVIPAYYHPDLAGPEFKGGSSKDAMYLFQPHHALRVLPVAVNLGDRLAHHHHQVLPDNPLAAHHYATESHLAVAAFHHLAEPHPVPVIAQQPFPNYFPTAYSQENLQSNVGSPGSNYDDVGLAQVREATYEQRPFQNSMQAPTHASQEPSSYSFPVQGSSDNSPTYDLNRAQEYPLSDLLGMLN